MNYQKQALDFISKHGITFSAVLIGSDCPKFCGDAEKSIDMDKVDVYPRRTHIHGKHYRCTFIKNTASSVKGVNKFLVIDYWNSYNDEEYNWVTGNRFKASDALLKRHGIVGVYGGIGQVKKKLPTPYDVLAILTKSDPGTFTDFCSEYGYDSDSMKAEQTYRAVVDEWRKVQQFFTTEELAEVQEIN